MLIQQSQAKPCIDAGEMGGKKMASSFVPKYLPEGQCCDRPYSLTVSVQIDDLATKRETHRQTDRERQRERDRKRHRGERETEQRIHPPAHQLSPT